MKKLLSLFILIQCSLLLHAQVPQLINYQGVARDNAGNPKSNSVISLRLSVLDASASGTAVYMETFNGIQTNQFGLFTVQIGNGTPVTGTFAGINWLVNSKWLRTEIDITGGTSYVVAGTAVQFVSSPYALYAANSNGWGLTGNTGTNSSTNFIGTTDNQALVFKVNNQKSGLIDVGSSNTHWGYQAGLATTTGTRNSFFGTGAGTANTTGSENAGFGQAALFTNTTGINNTAFGRASLALNTTGNENTATGHLAMQLNTTGSSNTAVGAQSLQNNTLGSFNTAIGTSLVGNTTGIDNTGVGWSSLASNTNGGDNTAVGYRALYANTTGALNAATGSLALQSNTTGQVNAAFGYVALQNNTTGNFNTGIGEASLNANTTGTFNTALGYQAFLFGANFNNSTALGANASDITGNNQVHIGNVTVTSIQGQVNFTTFSDRRAKKNIQENVPGLAFINKLRPVTYNYDVDQENAVMGRKDNSKPDWKYEIEKIQFSGFIAQEVDSVSKKMGYDFSGVDKSGPLLGLRYSEFVVPLVKAVQEQQQMIDELKKEVEELKKEIKKK